MFGGSSILCRQLSLWYKYCMYYVSLVSEAGLKEIGRASSYRELGLDRRVALSTASPRRLRRVLEAAVEEPRNQTMIDHVAAMSLTAAMRPDLMHKLPFDGHEESLDFMQLHHDALAAAHVEVESL
jgi:hypothetical protein